MSTRNKKPSIIISRVNAYRKHLGLTWSELADRYCIDRAWMRKFHNGVCEMHPSFSTSLSEDSGTPSTLWAERNPRVRLDLSKVNKRIDCYGKV